jgi:hypothetical protein
MPYASDVSVKGGLRLFSPATSLVKVTESFFARNPIETQVVLAGIRDASDVLRLLLDGGNTTKAGQLAGAFRRIGRPQIVGHKAGPDQPMRHQIGKPGGIVHIGLAAWHVLYMGSVG